MLVLTRRNGERLRLETSDGEEIWVTAVRCQSGQVRLGIEAPDAVTVEREELIEQDAA